jgi:hypothetical protein
MQFDVDRVSETPQSVDGTGQRELCRTKSVDEVAASNVPALFEHFQHRIHTGESPSHGFTQYRLTRDDSMPRKHLLGGNGEFSRAERGSSLGRIEKAPAP